MQAKKPSWVFYNEYIYNRSSLFTNLGVVRSLKCQVHPCFNLKQPSVPLLLWEFSAAAVLDALLSIEELHTVYYDFSNNKTLADCKNILKIHTVKQRCRKDSENIDLVCVVTEHAQNTSFHQKLKEKGCFPYEQANRYLIHLHAALERIAHENEEAWMHINPDFIFFDEEDNLKLSPLITLKEKKPHVIGYKNPSEASSESSKGFRSMHWNIGVIYYEMLSGKLPWEEEDLKDVDYPPQVNASAIECLDVSNDCKEILKKMLQTGDVKASEGGIDLVKDLRGYIEIISSAQNSQVTTKAKTSALDRTHHRNVTCSSCKNMNFKGARFSSINLSGLDFCAECFRRMKQISHIQNEAFIKIDKPFLPYSSEYDTAVDIYAVLDYCYKRHAEKDIPHLAICKISQLPIKYLETCSISGNPFMQYSKDRRLDVNERQKYVSDNDLEAGTGQLLYVDLSYKLPTFDMSTYVTADTICPYLSGDAIHDCILDVNRNYAKSGQHSSPFLDFLQNTYEASAIRLRCRNSKILKQDVKATFQKELHQRVTRFYTDNILHYYSIDVDDRDIWLLIERLDPSWIQLTTLTYRIKNFHQALNLMLKITESLINLHELGMCHGFLVPGIILVQEKPGKGDFNVKLGGLELSALYKFIESVDDAGNKPYIKEYGFQPIHGSQASNDTSSDIFALGIILQEMANACGLANYNDQELEEKFTQMIQRCSNIPIFRSTAEEVMNDLLDLQMIFQKYR